MIKVTFEETIVQGSREEIIIDFSNIIEYFDDKLGKESTDKLIDEIRKINSLADHFMHENITDISLKDILKCL